MYPKTSVSKERFKNKAFISDPPLSPHTVTKSLPSIPEQNEVLSTVLASYMALYTRMTMTRNTREALSEHVHLILFLHDPSLPTTRFSGIMITYPYPNNFIGKGVLSDV